MANVIGIKKHEQLLAEKEEQWSKEYRKLTLEFNNAVVEWGKKVSDLEKIAEKKADKVSELEITLTEQKANYLKLKAERDALAKRQRKWYHFF